MLNKINEVKTGRKKPEQNQVISNSFTNLISKSREEVLNSFRDCTKMAFEVKYKAKHGTGHKILTPKQILQRLSIALAQVNTGNNSENLLNETKQIVYFLYQSKKALKNCTIT